MKHPDFIIFVLGMILINAIRSFAPRKREPSNAENFGTICFGILYIYIAYLLY